MRSNTLCAPTFFNKKRETEDNMTENNTLIYYVLFTYVKFGLLPSEINGHCCYFPLENREKGRQHGKKTKNNF